MGNNEYVLTCTFDCSGEEMAKRYPNLQKYNFKIDHPYPNPNAEMVIVTVDDLRKFHDDIGEEIILGKNNILNNNIYTLEIYDDYRE